MATFFTSLLGLVKAAPQADATFTKFPELPSEIRLKIWRLAVNEPRQLRITDNQSIQKVPSPSTLLVNFESRQESMKVCSLLLGGSDLQGGSHLTYFNPKVDTVYFFLGPNQRIPDPFQWPNNHLIGGPPHHIPSVPPQDECDSVRTLEVDEELGDWRYHAVNFKNLDKIILRCTNSSYYTKGLAAREATEFYNMKLERGNCTRIPEIEFKQVSDEKPVYNLDDLVAAARSA